MKVKLDQDRCIACGACVAMAPENFGFDAEGLSTVINDEVTESARKAVGACPVYAISIEESEVMDKQKHECGEECKCGNSCTCKNDLENDSEEELKEAA